MLTRPFGGLELERSLAKLIMNSLVDIQWAKKLPDKIRKRFDDKQRFLLCCILCGLVCGILAVVFHLMIHYTFSNLWELASHYNHLEGQTWKFVMIMLIAPTVGGLICGLAIKYYVPAAIGSGIPQTKEAYHNTAGCIPFFTGIWRIILGTAYVGLGNSLGREGPMVHASAAVGSRIGRFIFKDPERVRAMIPVGMAAGIGAAFNAPLSAITFVFEELMDNFSTKAIGGMVVAVVIAAAVSRSILGEDAILSTHLSLNYETSVWMLVAIPLGFLAGLFGHFFVGLVLKSRSWVKKNKWLGGWYIPGIGGLLCGVIGLSAWGITGLIGKAEHGVFSIGYESLESAFENDLIFGVLVTLLLCKLLAVVINYATGGSGGLFSPTLFLGGMLGGLVGVTLVKANQLLPILSIQDGTQIVGGCVLLGMGAMFGSVIRCPFTSLIMIFELTGNYSLILPLMGGNMLSWAIARKLRPVAIYDALLLDDGVSLKSMPAYRGPQDYTKLPVRAIMTHDVVSVNEMEEALVCHARLKREGGLHHAYTVVDDDGLLVGIVTANELRECDAEIEIIDIVADKEVIHVTPEFSIRSASLVMVEHDIQQLPIVSQVDETRLLGIITMNDIARQQNAAEFGNL